MMAMPVRVLHGDCLRVMRLMRARGVQVDSIVTDPPYHLHSIVKRFGKKGSAPAKHGRDGAFKRASRGFMGKEWDGGDVAMNPETWALAWHVLKPGGHMLAFGGTRTFHRVAVAIEDAGFEIRDTVMWVYGTGFPKSHNVAKNGAAWAGWGTSLKPAWEPIIVARKPLAEKSVAANVLAHGTGAINVDACRVATDERIKDGGRFPANILHDGSEEVLEAFPAAPGQQADASRTAPSAKTGSVYGKMDRNGAPPAPRRGDTGSAARFFYSSKADKKDRAGSHHPTVKPVDLIAYLARLVTPPGGLVLDPFAGSGTMAAAAMREGLRAILIEREAEYIADIRRRLKHVSGGDSPLFADMDAR